MLKSTQTNSFVNIRHLSLLEISPAEALSSTMPRKAWRACMAALNSSTTKLQTNDPLPPSFAVRTNLTHRVLGLDGHLPSFIGIPKKATAIVV
jgi:hypothetical protein